MRGAIAAANKAKAAFYTSVIAVLVPAISIR
jgi:hypothetical protein